MMLEVKMKTVPNPTNKLRGPDPNQDLLPTNNRGRTYEELCRHPDYTLGEDGVLRRKGLKEPLLYIL